VGYIFCRCFSLFKKIFLVVDLGATSFQKLLDRSSLTFQGLVELCKGLIKFAFILQLLKGRCHGNQRKSEIGVLANLLCCAAIPKPIGISE